MLSNATSIAWISTAIDRSNPDQGNLNRINQHQRKERLSRKRRGPNSESDKENRNENQSDHPIRRRARQSPVLLYRSPGFHQEDRFQSGALSLADRSLARGAGRHRAAAGAEQQSRSQNLSTGDFSTAPARRQFLYR